MTSIKLCDSCHEADLQTKKHEDGPWLCEKCTEAFEHRTLKPTYWYNLAKVIGPNAHLLHDDFYDHNGFPLQPEVDIDENEYRSQCIDRKELSNNANEFLWEYLTRPIIWDDKIEIKEWQKDIAQPLLTKLIQETEVDEFRDKAYQLLYYYGNNIANVKAILSKHWMQHSSRHWYTMAKLAIKILSNEESLRIIQSALDGFPNGEIKQRMSILRHYGSTAALPLFRNTVKAKGVPLMSDLGAIYRCLNPSFADIMTDIKSGRPMSLVAIDSLWISTSRQYTSFFKGLQCVPIDPPIEVLAKVLCDYEKSDPAPRVLDAIKQVRKEYKIA